MKPHLRFPILIYQAWMLGRGVLVEFTVSVIKASSCPYHSHIIYCSIPTIIPGYKYIRTSFASSNDSISTSRTRSIYTQGTINQQFRAVFLRAIMSQKLPDSVVKLLNSKRFVHLATCFDNVPHVSLMNYTYYNKNGTDHIIISTPTCTTKYKNIVSNPNVSLLVHDWVASNPTSGEDSGKRRNSLFELLTNINRSEISSVSVMLNGTAEVVDKTSEDYEFLKSLHLNNSFIDKVQAENYITKDDNVLVLIIIKSCKVTDANDNVQLY